MRKLRSFRINKDLLDAALKQNVDMTAVFEAALAKTLKTKKCPYCGK